MPNAIELSTSQVEELGGLVEDVLDGGDVILERHLEGVRGEQPRRVEHGVLGVVGHHAVVTVLPTKAHHLRVFKLSCDKCYPMMGCTELCKIIVPCLKIPAPSAARQSDLPMPNQPISESYGSIL